jgi:hypothetical protein
MLGNAAQAIEAGGTAAFVVIQYSYVLIGLTATISRRVVNLSSRS